ncbi:MAG: hypothetical protein QHH24_03470 [Candidatus Bathyarchaeota archaeon]|nr:hypothetical protein [Candidatus Bathyarchaeota archaeon]
MRKRLLIGLVLLAMFFLAYGITAATTITTTQTTQSTEFLTESTLTTAERIFPNGDEGGGSRPGKT